LDFLVLDLVSDLAGLDLAVLDSAALGLVLVGWASVSLEWA
jgi:hypothetical protein